MVGATIPDLGVALSLENMPIACFPHKSDVLTLLLLMNKMIAAQQTSNFCHLNFVVMLHLWLAQTEMIQRLKLDGAKNNYGAKNTSMITFYSTKSYFCKESLNNVSKWIETKNEINRA